MGVEMTIALRETESPTEDVRMMEIIVTRQNMWRAYRRVLANKGAPGVDGMTVGQLKSFLKRCWPKIKQALLDGTYKPLPVRGKWGSNLNYCMTNKFSNYQDNSK